MQDVTTLRDERDSLAVRIERLQTEVALERATRRELEQQAAVLNAEVAELEGQVEFLKTRRSGGAVGE